MFRKLHRKLMNQVVSIGINEWKDEQKYTVTGPAMASMLIKVHKKNFPGGAYVSQIDEPTYKICKVLTDIMNPIDEKGESYVHRGYVPFQGVAITSGV